MCLAEKKRKGKKRMTKISQLHHLRTVKVSVKSHGNKMNHFWDISVRARVVEISMVFPK